MVYYIILGPDDATASERGNPRWAARGKVENPQESLNKHEVSVLVLALVNSFN